MEIQSRNLNEYRESVCNNLKSHLNRGDYMVIAREWKETPEGKRWIAAKPETRSNDRNIMHRVRRVANGESIDNKLLTLISKRAKDNKKQLDKLAIA